MISIESKENTLFKNIKKLKDKKHRVKEGKYIIEGFRLVEEAFKAGCIIETLVFDEKSKSKCDEWFGAYDISAKHFSMSTELFIQLCSTETPQGVIAVVEMQKDFNIKNGEFFLLCDKVQDPGNLGTIIRTAHAAGVSAIILTKGTVDIYNDKVLRSTMGSIFYMPIIHDDKLEYVNSLKEKGFKIVATSLQESKNFFEVDLKGKVVLTVGNEGNGVSEEIFELSDTKVKIPMPGGAESLNVSIASSIILFEKVRQDIC